MLRVDFVLQVLGSSGGEGHRKQMRLLEKEAERRAREAAAAATEARFSQPEPLSPEFQFVVRMTNRCAAAAALALHVKCRSSTLQPSAEARQNSDRLITVRQLRLFGTSGLLLKLLLQLSRHRTCHRKTSGVICSMTLARVSARQTTPEVCGIPKPSLTFAEAILNFC
jgi:hypothetical protein